MRYLLLLLVVLASCEVKVSTGKEEPKEAKNKSKIRNGIAVKTTGGVSVEQAFLTYADDGTLVDENNSTAINKPVKINLVVKGWKEAEGRIYIDAEQKVTTSEGDTVLIKKDMLAEVGEITAQQAEYLNFQVVITKLNKLFDYFLVEVKARNTKAAQAAEASFKLHIE
ncbi:MAG TPA: hypothetical protein VM884_08075 [Flavisolibacter sp.]|jgi:ASC-1-like (ASCH) protein|nr:hypothetical protein [Flavisolibacter sp.]